MEIYLHSSYVVFFQSFDISLHVSGIMCDKLDADMLVLNFRSLYDLLGARNLSVAINLSSADIVILITVFCFARSNEL